MAEGRGPSIPAALHGLCVMSASDGPTSNVVGVRDVYDIVARLETKIDSRMEDIERKVDRVTSRMDRIEGGLGMLKWLGPTGLVALVYGGLKAAGYL